MSEKRFEMRTTIIDPFPIWDSVEEKGYNCTDTLDLLVELLNKLYEENEQLKSERRNDAKEFSALFNQSIALQREIKDLKEENEQLRKELNDCEKFRYQVFKRMEELDNE